MPLIQYEWHTIIKFADLRCFRKELGKGRRRLRSREVQAGEGWTEVRSSRAHDRKVENKTVSVIILGMISVQDVCFYLLERESCVATDIGNRVHAGGN